MNFGLKNRTYDTDPEFDPERQKTQWERFENHVRKLNNQTPENVRYKVLYCMSFQFPSHDIQLTFEVGRHGEGYHNIKETEVGKEAWDVCLILTPNKRSALTLIVLLVTFGRRCKFHVG